jgi:putative membrane protein
MTHEKTTLLSITSLALAASAWQPYHWPTWWLEVLPVLIAVPILAATARSFELTPLAYRLLCAHALILILGGHYSYGRVPLGFWMQDLFGFARNHYDRIGHLAQGFVPAIIAREILVRTSPLRGSRWLEFIVVCVCLAISALYEMVEWWAALIGGVAAEAFLGTQGDPWDTQWDMFLATIGAIGALLLLSRMHDRQLANAVERPRA